IYVVKLQWRHAVDLDHNLSTCHRVVMLVWVHIGETADRKSYHRHRLKAITHPNLEDSRDDGDVFPQRMPMRCYAVAVRHLQANGVVPAGGAWVALEHCQLRARVQECRWRAVLDGIGCEGMFFRRSSLCADGKGQTHAARQPGQCKHEVYVT